MVLNDELMECKNQMDLEKLLLLMEDLKEPRKLKKELKGLLKKEKILGLKDFSNE